jgi:hypothetical protein
MTNEQLLTADAGEERASETRRRNAVIQTLGNLTILRQALNTSVSNGPWAQKKPALLQHSLLPINQKLHEVETWDEDAIVARGNALFDRAIQIWPR